MKRVHVLVPAVLAVGVTLGTATPALAHGARAIVVVHPAAAVAGELSVSADVSFVDGDPVPDALLTATAASGSSQLPVTLTPTRKAGTFAGTTQLAPGTWQVTVRSLGTADDAHEALGEGQATVVVAAATGTAARTARSDGSHKGVLGAGAALVLLLGAGSAWTVRRRRSAASDATSPARPKVPAGA